MSLASFLNNLRARSALTQAERPFHRSTRKKFTYVRPSLEQLEDRTLLSTLNWMNPAGGDWDTASNWVDDQGVNRLPGPLDKAVINQPGSITITHSQGNDSINSLLSNQSILLSGGILTVTTTVEVDNAFTLSGGILASATVLPGSGGQGVTVAGNSNNKLDGVTLDANLDLSSNGNALVRIDNGLTLNGTVTLDNGARLVFEQPGSQQSMLAGTGTVVFAGDGSTSYLNVDGTNTLTVAAGITLEGRNGIAGTQVFNGGPHNLVNQGQIVADGAGTLEVGGWDSFTNQGTLRAQNGGNLIVSTTITNYAGGTLTDGSWQAFANSILQLNTAGIITNDAAILLDGPNSNLLQSNGTDALAGFTTNDVVGSFTIQHGRNFTTAGQFINLGSLIVTGGASLGTSGAFTNAGATTVSGSFPYYQFSDGQISLNVPQLNTVGGAADTVSFWMDWDGTKLGIPISFYNYDLELVNGGFGFNTNNNDILGISSAGLTNQWHFVTAVFVNGNVSQNQLWIDGVQQTLTQRQGAPAAVSVSTSALIGAFVQGPSYNFTGGLSDVTFFNHQLTPAQIQTEYNAHATATAYNAAVLGQGPAAYYQLNETSGSVAADSSGNGNNGTLSGAVTLGGALTSTLSANAFQNSGTVQANVGGTVNSSYTQTGGSITLAGGTISPPDSASITLKSDSSTLAASLGSAPLSNLDTGDSLGLSFTSALVGSFGTNTPVPPGAPPGTSVLNIPPGNGQSGFFEILFNLPGGFSNPQLTGAGNVDDVGRVFLNDNPISPSIFGSGALNEFGNGTFSTSDAAFFQTGQNVLLFSDDNSGGGPSGAAFYATITYTQPGTVNIRGGTLSGTGTISGNLFNSGQIGGTAPPTNSLVSSWRADGNAFDSVSGNNGTLVGGVTYSAGKSGQAFNFDGATGYVNVSSSANLNIQNALTLEAWVNPSQYAAAIGNALIAGRPGGYQFNILPTGQIRFAFPETGFVAVNQYVDSASIVPLNVFTHIAATFDSATGLAKVYLNGVLDNTAVLTGPISSMSKPFQIGAFNDPAFTGGFFKGLIEDLGIYNRALTQAEIQATVNGGGATIGAPGILTVSGNYTQSSNGTLDEEVGGAGPGSGYDQLNVNGTATLAGNLNVSLINGFVPPADSNCQILTFASLGGDFASKNGLAPYFVPIYNPTNLTLAANGPVLIVTGTLPNWTINQPYSQTISTNGGFAPLTFSVSSRNLPTGLSLDSTSGIISGTPTATGAYNFTVTVTDATGATSTQPYSVTINPPPAITTGTSSSGNLITNGGFETGDFTGWTVMPAPVSFLFVNSVLPHWGSYAATIAAYGAPGQFDRIAQTFSTIPGESYNLSYWLWNGSLAGLGTIPEEFIVNWGSTVISDVKDAPAFPYSEYTFTLTAISSTTTLEFSGYLPPGRFILDDVSVIAMGTLPNWTINQPYSQSIPTSSGTAPLTFSLTSGSLPTGLGLDSASGLISGTPTATGSDSFTISLRDAAGATASQQYALTINPAPVISTTSLPDSTVNQAYSASVLANGGTAPLTFSVSAGSLPTGLSLNSSSGVFSGTPTTAGTYDFTIEATDAASAIASEPFNVTIYPVPVASVTLDPTSDSGAPDHPGFTNTSTPTFDVQANQPGTINLDFESNGANVSTLAVAAAGTYLFTAPTLADGTYTATATFTATGGTIESSTTYTIDTIGPNALSMTPSGTLNNRISQATVTFSEPVDLNNFSPSAITLMSPSGAISVNQPQLVSGSTYTISFPTQTVEGTYTLTIAASVTDFAGNSMNQSFTGSFKIALPDLAITATSAPPSAVLGASIPVSWTVANLSPTNPAPGAWTDSVYLSTNSVLDNTAIRLTSVSAPPLSPLGPGASYTDSVSVTVPGNIATGNYFLLFAANDNDGQLESDASTDTNDVIVDAITLSAPDLVVTSISGPASGFTSQSVLVSWNDQNNGTALATGSWEDKVYAAADAQGDNPTLLGSFTFNGALAIGASLQRTIPVALPSTSGTYWFMVQTNASRTVAEATNFDNNTLVSSQAIQIQPTPLPNLQVSSVTAPSSAFSSQQTVVSWQVTNVGTGSTSAPPWDDRVYLSLVRTLDDSAVVLGDAPNPSYLAVGDSYSNSLTVTLPQGINGNYYFLVQTDAMNQVRELDKGDNVGSGGPTVVQLTPPPDLQVDAVGAPSPQPFSGQTTTVTWTVGNHGPGRTLETAWYDDVYMSANGTLDRSAYFLGRSHHTGALNPNDTYTTSLSVTLPVDVSGDFFFLVKTDSLDNVYEGPFKDNNVGQHTPATSVLLTPPPDLDVTGTVQAPVTALASHPLTITYGVSNLGSTATPNSSWTDAFYLSPTTTLDTNTALHLGDLTHFGALDAGASYDGSATFKLPDGLSGSYYAFVVTDKGNAVFELDKSNNSDYDHDHAVLVLSQPADLIVSSASVAATAEAGQTFRLQWTVTNQGSGDTAVTSWNDAVYATMDLVPGHGSLLGTYSHSGLLDSGQSHSRTEDVVVPFALAGQYNVFVVTNANQAVFEDDHQDNNASLPLPLTVMRNTPDFQVTAVSGDPTAIAGTSFTSNWTVKNFGVGSTNSNYWYDGVWLSTDKVLSNDDIFLGDVRHTNPLGSLEQYSASVMFTLPDDLSGSYYVIVEADTKNQVFKDPSETNNVRAADIATLISPGVKIVPDLVVADVTAPANALTGQPITVSWTVRNDGDDTRDQTWSDSIYLSYDQVFDPTTDVYLDSVYHNGGLAHAASYTAARSVTIPRGLSGPFYVFVAADSSNFVANDNALHKVGYDPTPTMVSLLPPADLVVGAITVPPSGIPGQSATISYTVTNQSRSPAQGTWVDSIFVSADPSWDVHDPLFGRVQHSGDVAPGASYSETLAAALPGLTPGSYYVIVRADIRRNLPESNDNNHTGVSSTQIAVDAQELALGTPALGTLAQGQDVFYKVSIAAAQTLLVTFNSNLTFGFNELYVSFGNMPSRGQFDFASIEPFSPSQQVAVPTTQAGTYYILAHGTSVPNGSDVDTGFQITARIPAFEILDVQPSPVSNAGPVTLTVHGSHFQQDTVFNLLTPAGAIPASRVFFQDSTLAYVTFDLTGAAPGTYALQASRLGGTVQLDNAVTIENGSPGQLADSITGPSAVRPGRTNRMQINYGNSGQSDVASPLLILSTPTSTPFRQQGGTFDDDTIALIALSPDGPVNVLRPGMAASYAFDFKSSTNSIDYGLDTVETTDLRPFDLGAYAQFFRPDQLTDAEWNQTLDLLASRISGPNSSTGPTYGDLARSIGETAQAMALAGNGTNNVVQIFEEMVLQALGALTGTVRSAADNSAMAGVHVSLQSWDGREYFADTSADGGYVFRGFPAGTYSLTFESPDYLPHHESNVQIQQGTTDVLDVNMDLGARISGKVTFPDGTSPVARATVIASADTGITYNGVTEPDGTYQIAGLDTGLYTVTALADGFLPSAQNTVQIIRPDVVSMDFVLQPAGTISGTVVDGVTGTGMPNVVIQARSDQTGAIVSAISTDSNGSYLLKALSPGNYTLNVVASSMLPADGDVTLAAGQQLMGVNFALLPGGSIDGTVYDINSNPMPGIVVELDDPLGNVTAATTDNAGTYQFTGLTAGNYLVFSPLASFAPAQTVTITDLTGNSAVVADLTAQIALPTELEGHLIAADGTELSVGLVALVQADQVIDTALVDESGAYHFFLTTGGVFDLVATAQGPTFAAVTGITVDSGSHVTQDIISGTSSLLVKLNDVQGSAGGATVTLWTTLAGQLTPVAVRQADPDGSLEFTDLATGTYLILATTDANRGAQTTVTVSVDASTNVDLSLGDFATVSGTITDLGNKTLAGVQIGLLPTGDTNGPLVQLLSQSDGTYTVSGVAPGTYDIVVLANGYRTAVQTGVMIGSGANSHSFQLAVAASTITGKVVDASGTPVVVAIVDVLDAQGHILALGRTGRDGSYSLLGFEGSDLRLVVGAKGYAPITVALPAVPTTGTLDLGDLELRGAALAPSIPLSQTSNQPALLNQLQQALDVPQPVPVPQAFAQRTQQEADRILGLPAPVDPPFPQACRNCTFLYNTAQNLLAKRDGLWNTVQRDAQTTKADSQDMFRTFAAEFTSTVGATAGLGVAMTQATVAFLGGGIQGINALSNALGFTVMVRRWVTLVYTITNAIKATYDLNSAINQASSDPSFDNAVDSLGKNAVLHAAIADLAKAISLKFAIGFPQTIFGLSPWLGGVVAFGDFLLLWLRDPYQSSKKLADILDTDYSTLQTDLQTYGRVAAQFSAAYSAYLSCLANCPTLPPTPQKHYRPAVVTPKDPNDILGPIGFGPENWVPASQPLDYTIRFENDPAVATAPAQQVRITEKLDPSLDFRTFRVGDFGFGDLIVSVPANRAFYTTRIDLTATRGIFVDVSAGIDVTTGEAFWEFDSIDPATGEPTTDATKGFLPPDINGPEGEGFVNYSVKPRASATTGKEINAKATIVFDTEPPLDTPQIFNTLDAVAPTSQVAPLPSFEPDTTFQVQWSGTDDPNGSALSDFTIFVSDNGVPFTPWLDHTTLTEAPFDGQRGHSYAFYSIARDNAGNEEIPPANPQAVTIAGQVPTTVNVASDHPGGSTYGQLDTFSVAVSPTISAVGTPTGSVQLQIDGANYGNPVALSGGMASIAVATLAAGQHTIAAFYASDGLMFGNSDDGTIPLGQTVNPAPLVVSADNQIKVYGSPNPAFTASYAGFVLGQDPSVLGASLSFTTAASAASHVGQYTIWPAGLTSINYSITFVAGTLTVTPAPLTIIADDKSMIYGGTLSTLTASFSGLVNGDIPVIFNTSPNVAPSLSTVSAASHAGSYAITVSRAVDPDYSIALVPGTLTIAPAPLTITANNLTKVYGAPLPALTDTFTGLVNGDSPAVFNISPNVAPTLTTTATASSDVIVGGYPISVSGAVDPDYSITFNNGTLMITPANQSINWNNPAAIILGTPLGSTQLNATVSGVGPAPAGSLTYTPPVGTVLGLGSGQILSVTAAATQDYNSATATVVINVLYNFSGFQPPLSSGLSFAAGRPVPIKFQLTDVLGNYISSLSAVTALQVTYPDGSIHSILTGLKYDSTANQYVDNWQTKGLATGSYAIALSLLDGRTHTVTVKITSGHGSAGLTTDVAGGTGAAPGGLLGGNIELYVDNGNGDLTADELARIQDAVTAADAVVEPYGVTVSEVTDPTQTDVTLNMDTTSAVGGYADGVLGCTTDAGQITIISGWNFYAGSDTTQIGSSQYDFETVVTHELGHALGLGHSSDSTSVMYATLNTGTVNRSMTTADLNVPDSDTGGACGHTVAASESGLYRFIPETFGKSIAIMSGNQEQPDSFAKQAALNAILAELASATDFPNATAGLFEKDIIENLLSRSAMPNIHDLDEFWSSINDSILIDNPLVGKGGR